VVNGKHKRGLERFNGLLETLIGLPAPAAPASMSSDRSLAVAPASAMTTPVAAMAVESSSVPSTGGISSAASAAAPAPPAAAAAAPPVTKPRGIVSRPPRSAVGALRLNQKGRKRARPRASDAPDDEAAASQGYQLMIQNIVYKARIPNAPDMFTVCQSLFGNQLSSFPSSTIHLKSPRCSVSQYETREVSIAGAQSEMHALISAHRLAAQYARVRPDGIYALPQNCGPVNYTTSANVGRKIDLPRFARDFGNTPGWKCSFDPDRILAVQYKRVKYNAKGEDVKDLAVNVWPSGIICAVGFSTRTQIAEWDRHHFQAIRAWIRDTADAADAAAASRS